MRKVYLIIIAALVLVLAAVVVRFLANSNISKAPPVHQSREVFVKNNTEYLVNPEYLVIGCDPFPTPGEDRLVPASGEDPNLDCIASIDKPRFVSAKEADDFISEEELVVGIDYKNKQKAYPIKNIFKHEVVNDKFGEDPFLVTYCPLNGAAVVFERRVKNIPVEFGVSGRLYNNDLVMYDRKSGSLWLQVTGQAIAGPLIREKLNQIPAEVVPWKTWRADYPDTLVLASTGEVRGPAAKFDKIFASYEDTPNVPFPLAPIGEDFPRKAWFRGVSIGGEIKAYPEDLLYKQSEVEDIVGGVPIVITSDVEKQRLRFFVRDAKELTPLPDIRLYWFSWKSIYPDTTVY